MEQATDRHFSDRVSDSPAMNETDTASSLDLLAVSRG